MLHPKPNLGEGRAGEGERRNKRDGEVGCQERTEKQNREGERGDQGSRAGEMGVLSLPT